jgi:P2 family phage contractile tail tube protein
VFRGTLNDDASTATRPVVATLRGALQKIEHGSLEAGKVSEEKFTMDVKFYELKVNGREVYYIDNDNMIRRIGGVDQLESQRGDLGL